MPLNPNAASFTFNPNASAFVPSFGDAPATNGVSTKTEVKALSKEAPEFVPGGAMPSAEEKPQAAAVGTKAKEDAKSSDTNHESKMNEKRPSSLNVSSNAEPGKVPVIVKEGAPASGTRSYDIPFLLSLRNCGTPVAEMADFKKTLEDTPELDPEKEMPARQQGDGGTPRRVQRQDSGTPRTPKSGRGKNDAPLRDRNGRIIEIKALEMSENRWKPAKPTDDEEKVYKSVKGLLNKLTLEKFDTIYAQLKDIGIVSASLLKGFVVILYDKAVLEPTFISMYAQMCEKLSQDLPEFPDESGPDLAFADVLLGKCRHEFASFGKEPEREGLDELPTDEKEQKLKKIRQRCLGNVEFIGALFKRQMVGNDEVNASIEKLLGNSIEDSESIQPLCKLLEGVGALVEQQDKALMDSYFEKIDGIINGGKLNSRFKFMLLDLKDLRTNKWVPRRAAAGPKLLQEVQKEVDKENRYTEKKKEDKKEDKKKSDKREKKKKNVEIKNQEEEGWSQVGGGVVTSRGKGKGKQVQAAPSPGKAAPKAPSKGIPGGRGGFAALMMDDDDDDDDSSSDSDSDEDDDEEEEDKSEEEEAEEEEEEAPKHKVELSEEAENKVGSILEEYLCIHDTEEALQCLLEMHEAGHNKEAVNEEIVRKGLLLALEAGDKESELMGKMFKVLLEKSVLTQEGSSKGFCDVLAELPDITIDIPHAPGLMASIIQGLLEASLLNKDIVREGLNTLAADSPGTAKHFDEVANLAN